MALFTSRKTSAQAEATSAPLFSSDGSEARRAKAWLDSRLARAQKGGAFDEIVELTPAMAELLKALNTANRRIRRSRVAQLVKIIKAGAWRTTHQGIAIAMEGIVLDGQHRIEAVIEAATSIRIRIFWGEVAENFAVIDTHAVRDAADTLRRLGEDNSVILAAILRMLRAIEIGQPRSLGIDTALRNDELEEYLAANPGARKASTAAVTAISLLKCAPTPVGVAYYFISQKYPSKADMFYETFRTGLGLTSQQDPLWVLRKEVNEHFTYGKRDGRPRAALAANIIIAFNKWNAGRRTRSVKWADDADFPVVE